MTLEATEEALITDVKLRQAMVYQEQMSNQSWFLALMTSKCLMSSIKLPNSIRHLGVEHLLAP